MTSIDAGGPTLGDILDSHARGYAQAVRLHLADLGPDVVEDLTGGLEADLADALAEVPLPATTGRGEAQDDVALDLVAHFGPAADYAAELRRAAGLPPALPPAGRSRRGVRARLAARRAALVQRWARMWQPLTSMPQWAALRGLGRELRPVWWVLRGWVVGAVLVVWFGTGGPPSLLPRATGDALIMAACALVSVQWARGRWLPRVWLPRATVAATAVAVLAVPFVASATRDQSVHGAGPAASGGYEAGYAAGYDEASMVGYDGYGGIPGEDGVWVDGMQVSNLFAYDANGDPIKDVQLYDDRGRPVRTVTSDGGEEQTWAVPGLEGTWYFRPVVADDGRERWNVYPLRAVPEREMRWDDAGETLQPDVGVQPETMPWPFLKSATAVGGQQAGPDEPDDEPDDGAGDEADAGAQDDGDGKAPGPTPTPDSRGVSSGGTTEARGTVVVGQISGRPTP